MSTTTPHEAWFGKKPYVECLKVFGCIAFMKIPAVHTKKIDDRSQMVVHFRREPGTKAYRLFDPVVGKIHISRDVIFSEDKAWEWETDDNSRTHGSTNHFTFENFVSTEVNESDTWSNNSGSPTSPVTPQTSVSAPSTSQSPNEDSAHSSTSSASSEHPQRFRPLTDIYAHTTELEIEDELLLMGIDEPTCFE